MPFVDVPQVSPDRAIEIDKAEDDVQSFSVARDWSARGSVVTSSDESVKSFSAAAGTDFVC
jgi:hypothetical protein